MSPLNNRISNNSLFHFWFKGCDPAVSPITATPLHKDWVTETSDFLSVMVLNLPYLNREFFGAPDCQIDDGVLWLMLVRQNVSRLSLIQMMLRLENGEHVNMPGIDIFPVSAVKISVNKLFRQSKGVYRGTEFYVIIS